MQARLVSTLSGQPIINNISTTLVSPFADWATTALNMLNALQTALELTTDGGIWTASRGVNFRTTELQVIDVFPGVSPMVSFGLGNVGVEVSGTLPPNDCCSVTFRSNFKGAGGRGRMYLAGYTEADATDGFWELGVQNAVDGIAAALDTSMGEFAGASSFRWCVLHRSAGGSPIIPPEVKPIMSWTVHNEIRSLSRRAMGRRIRRSVTP